MQNSARGTDDGRKWTTWEGYNYILKGLVDELISLGARPQLKLVTLQLWAKYLGMLEIAFTSKTEPLIPKFAYHQPPKDYNLIKELIKERKANQQMLDAKPSSSESHECVQASKLPGRPTKRAKEKRSQDTTEESDKDMIATEVDDEIQFNAASRAYMKGIPGFTDFSMYCATIVCNIRQKNLLRQLTCFDPMFLKKRKVLGILCLGLFFSRDSIQLSDVIRWIRESHVDFMRSAFLFPEGIDINDSKMMGLTETRNVRYKTIQRCAFHIATMMGIDVFPAPDLAALTRRFVLEMQLPSALGDYVERLMVHCRVGLCKQMVGYEAVVMAFIIVVLKTLFGLDGRTEHSISKFATEINSLMNNVEGTHVGSRLFVWDDWVRYIECRKSVIISKHFPSQFLIESDLSAAVGQYAQYCTKQQIKDERVMEKNVLSDQSFRHAFIERQSHCKHAVAQLPTRKKLGKAYEFTPSLTPQVSYLEQILSKSGTVSNMDVLTYDHTATSMEFLIQPQAIIELARSQGVDVLIRKSPVYQNLEYITKGEYEALRVVPNCPELSVAIKDRIHPQPKPQVVQRLPEKNKRKRRRYYDSNSNNNESLKRQRSREKETIPTSCLNYGSSNTTLDNTKEGKHFREETRATSSTRHNPLTLHMPFPYYWVYEVLQQEAEGAFINTIEPDFSHSFRWLLSECTRMLEMKTPDLHRVVRQVEQLCAGEEDPTVLQLTFRVRNKKRREKYQD